MRKFNVKGLLAMALTCMTLTGMQTGVYEVSAEEATTKASTETTATTATTGSTKTTDTTSSNLYAEGDVADIKITGIITQPMSAGGVSGVGFWTCAPDKLDDGSYGGTVELISVRPTETTSGPFVQDDCMYAIAEADGNTKYELWCGFPFNVKNDVKTGYYSIPFTIDYAKDAIHYRVVKNVDVYLVGTEETTDSANVSVPRVIVTGYETNPEEIFAGQEFELTVHLKNTSSDTSVSNMKVTFSTANGEFLPVSGSSTEFVNRISAGATTDLTLTMKASASLEQKPYVLNMAAEYEGKKAAAYTASESISIPVHQKTKFTITEMDAGSGSVENYGTVDVSFAINNTGKTTMYNVQAYVSEDCKTLTSDKTFVGNIIPGSTGYVDLPVHAIAVTEDEGNVDLVISYEDADGVMGTETTTANIYVYEPYIPTEEEMQAMYGDGMQEEKAGMSPWLGALIGLVVIAVVVIVVVILVKNKKKRERLSEEDDEIL